MVEYWRHVIPLHERRLSVWLKEAGLDESAIAHFKYNALAKKFPDLADIIEDAKKLIGAKATVPSVGMTVLNRKFSEWRVSLALP